MRLHVVGAAEEDKQPRLLGDVVDHLQRRHALPHNRLVCLEKLDEHAEENLRLRCQEVGEEPDQDVHDPQEADSHWEDEARRFAGVLQARREQLDDQRADPLLEQKAELRVVEEQRRAAGQGRLDELQAEGPRHLVDALEPVGRLAVGQQAQVLEEQERIPSAGGRLFRGGAGVHGGAAGSRVLGNDPLKGDGHHLAQRCRGNGAVGRVLGEVEAEAQGDGLGQRGAVDVDGGGHEGEDALQNLELLQGRVHQLPKGVQDGVYRRLLRGV